MFQLQDPSDDQVRRIARATVILLQADLRRNIRSKAEPRTEPEA